MVSKTASSPPGFRSCPGARPLPPTLPVGIGSSGDRFLSALVATVLLAGAASCGEAHAPGFADATLWPHARDAEYGRQAWPPAPILRWSGGAGSWKDAKRWTIDGVPAGRVPGAGDDVVLPAAAEPYQVQGGGGLCRHLSIGRHAGVDGGRVKLRIAGNAWVEAGGRLFGADAVGAGHCFLRYEREAAEEIPEPSWERRQKAPMAIGDKMVVAKSQGGSLEVIGTVGVLDEIYVVLGTLALGPGSQFRLNCATGNGTLEVFKDAALRLHDGAVVANQWRSGLCDIAIHAGAALEAGTAARPLRADAFVRLDPSPGGREHGILLAPGSALRVHSADPAAARLVFTANEPARSLPEGHGITVSLGCAGPLHALRFAQLAAPGLLLPDPLAPRDWTAVDLGPGNAPGEAIGRMPRSEVIPTLNARREKYDLMVRKNLETMDEYLPEKASGPP